MAKRIQSKSTRYEKIQVTPEPVTQPHQTIAPEKKVVQRKTRPTPVASNEKLVQEIQNILDTEGRNYYLGFGGTGDALLTLASCWNDPRARVFFFANGGSHFLVNQFYALFDITLFLKFNIMGNPIAGKVFRLITQHPNFKMSGHLADGLWHGDWANEDKYVQRIKSKVPWINKLGTKNVGKNHIVICPSGSERNPARQRFLTIKELKSLIDIYTDKGFAVYCTGSDSDYSFYKSAAAKCMWISTNYFYAMSAKRAHSLKEMLQIINAATEVISMDTWLKTYSLLCDIPTTVIRTRWNGTYLPYGRDITDCVFLSKKIWPKIKFAQIEELI